MMNLEDVKKSNNCNCMAIVHVVVQLLMNDLHK